MYVMKMNDSGKKNSETPRVTYVAFFETPFFLKLHFFLENTRTSTMLYSISVQISRTKYAMFGPWQK
jgi:hypothetical protein